MTPQTHIAKILKPKINGKICYCRVPIAHKIIGTGAKDTSILLEAGVPKSTSDLSYHLTTGAYSLNHALAEQKDYCDSFSTTRLIQLLPPTFISNGQLRGVMLYPGRADGFGRSSLVGVIVDIASGEQVKEFQGHPVSVLVQLIEFTMKESKPLDQ